MDESASAQIASKLLLAERTSTDKKPFPEVEPVQKQPSEEGTLPEVFPLPKRPGTSHENVSLELSEPRETEPSFTRIRAGLPPTACSCWLHNAYNDLYQRKHTPQHDAIPQ